MPQLLAAFRELEVVWFGFQVEDNAAFDAICEISVQIAQEIAGDFPSTFYGDIYK